MPILTLYPTLSFPGSVLGTINEVIHHTQAPVAMVALSALGVMSASLQGILDVCLPIGKVCPVSINALVIAESGERKSAVDNLLSAAIHEFDLIGEQAYTAALADYKIKARTWTAIETGYHHRIRKLIAQGEEVDVVQAQLEAHALTKPVKPRRRRILRGNITSKSMMEALDGGGESIAFMAAEGGILTKGGALSQVEMLNDCWSGVQSLSVDRANGEHLVVRNPRVTISFMVQEAVLQAYEARHGRITRGSGHWARYLVAQPESTQGHRFLYSTDQVWRELPKFHERGRRLLDEQKRRVEMGNTQRTTLHCSPDAKGFWRDGANWVEGQLGETAYLSDIRDFSSKMMEIVARVAALLHCYGLDVEQVVAGDVGEISIETMRAAMSLVEWHMHEFKRIFAPQSLIDQVQADAQELERRLHRDVWCKGFFSVRKNVMLQYGPLRQKRRLDAAIEILVSMRRIEISEGIGRTKYITLNPNYFASLGQI
ncbi:YfjI family protein [Ralstonia sp. 25C]|uniref:YfjI family protein n=1 Tax=Ralstonia sp. 25C TaxID=3447363 RepID=UPI003F74CE54